MFELGTTDHWWEIAKKYPELSNQPNTLKPLGYAHIVNLIESFNPKTILEIGHGSFSFIFEIFYNKIEIWGIDDFLEDSTVSNESLNKIRNEYPEVRFVKGFLGNNIRDLPDNYFDLIYSVSVIEHVPESKLENFFEESKRIIKPGGITAHSYDVYYKQNTKSVFDAHLNSGFEWLKSKDTMNVFWEKWLCNYNSDDLEYLFANIMTENPMQVAEIYMWEQDRKKRQAPVNYFSILTAAKKPETNYASDNSDAKSSFNVFENKVTPGNFNSFTYSQKMHFDLFNDNNYSQELYGKEVTIETCDVKVYQNLLIYSFIRQNIKKGGRILQIGNNPSQLLNILKNDFECWNIRMNEKEKISKPEDKNIFFYEDYVGNEEVELKSEFFDFIFSTAALEENENSKDNAVFRSVYKKINEALTKNGYYLQCLTSVLKNSKIWIPDILNYIYEYEKPLNKFVHLFKISIDPDLFVMSEKYYIENWEQFTGKTYKEFGKPFSYNVLLEKITSFS